MLLFSSICNLNLSLCPLDLHHWWSSSLLTLLLMSGNWCQTFVFLLLLLSSLPRVILQVSILHPAEAPLGIQFALPELNFQSLLHVVLLLSGFLLLPDQVDLTYTPFSVLIFFLFLQDFWVMKDSVTYSYSPVPNLFEPWFAHVIIKIMIQHELIHRATFVPLVDFPL
jgi:hypothetical protein